MLAHCLAILTALSMLSHAMLGCHWHHAHASHAHGRHASPQQPYHPADACRAHSQVHNSAVSSGLADEHEPCGDPDSPCDEPDCSFVIGKSSQAPLAATGLPDACEGPAQVALLQATQSHRSAAAKTDSPAHSAMTLRAWLQIWTI